MDHFARPVDTCCTAACPQICRHQERWQQQPPPEPPVTCHSLDATDRKQSRQKQKPWTQSQRLNLKGSWMIKAPPLTYYQAQPVTLTLCLDLQLWLCPSKLAAKQILQAVVVVSCKLQGGKSYERQRRRPKTQDSRLLKIEDQ